jgi:hypothetical protein
MNQIRYTFYGQLTVLYMTGIVLGQPYVASCLPCALYSTSHSVAGMYDGGDR